MPTAPLLFSRHDRIPVGMMALLVLLLAGPTFQFDFIGNWDDDLQLMDNPYVQAPSFRSLIQLFSEPVAGMYQPVVSTAFMLEAALFGPKAGVFHFFSVLWHLMAVLGLYFLAKQFFDRPKLALGLALVFACYPAAAEPVAWLSARSTLMYASLGLWALVHWWRFLQFSHRTSLVYALVFLLLAMFSKVQGILFPLLMFLLWFLASGPYRPAWWYTLLPFLPLPWVLHLGLRYRPELGEAQDIGSLITTAGPKFLWFLQRLVYFGDTSPVYPPLDVGLPAVLGFLLGTIAVFLALRWFWQRQWKGFFLLFYLLFVGIHLIQFSIGNPVADRYAYVPFAGMLLFLGALLLQLPEKKIRWAFLPVLVYFSFSFHQALKPWQATDKLWTHATRVQPDYYFAWEKLANTKAAKADFATAIKAYDQALALEKGSDRLYFNAALAYFQLGNRAKAEAYYLEAIALDGGVYFYYMNLGRVQYERGAIEEAKQSLLRGYALQPEDPQVNMTLAGFAIEARVLDPCPYLEKAAAAGVPAALPLINQYCK